MESRPASGGVKRRFGGAQQSSSHIVFARIHIIEVFDHSPSSHNQRVSHYLTLKFIHPESREGTGLMMPVHYISL